MGESRRSLLVLQHTEAEFLGLVEDHLEGRGIRFRYVRPFVDARSIPGTAIDSDGLVMLGGGGWGTAGAPILPTLRQEQRLARDFLNRGRPVVGFGLGAQILCLAAGGGSSPNPLVLRVVRARRAFDDALNGFLPESFPLVMFGRDTFQPPEGARVLAVDEAGAPALVQIGDKGFAFAGHPGCKLGMLEDLVMEVDEAPDDCTGALDALRAAQPEIHAALARIVTGLMQVTGLMRPRGADERRRMTIIPLRPG